MPVKPAVQILFFPQCSTGVDGNTLNKSYESYTKDNTFTLPSTSRFFEMLHKVRSASYFSEYVHLFKVFSSMGAVFTKK